MNNDVRDGLAIGAVFAGLVALSPAHAEAKMTVKELCDGAIKYSIDHMPEEESFKLHQARWAILNGSNTDDNQKLIGLVMFEIGQRISYSMTEELNPGNEVWWNEVIENMYGSCTRAYGEMNSDPFDDMEGKGNIW
jgi:hypothetical protein